ncbi:MAG: hypothetical protein IOD03_07530 [Methylocystis sp.]|nr:hypothetical protein [Rhodobacter sp.]MCA3583525.1 hypothetical protein [Methylocystis sp.]MCA3461535.1 hypothetical protein [Rhodobacter sp.]MCA3464461.1 hypothetical protein [Rhodobacter sp.]MCA3466270.1 hypothetical protein [Rhodobacter sp.]
MTTTENTTYSDPRRYLRRAEASDYLARRWGISRVPGTLAKLATTGGGPRFQKLGKWPLYSPAELDRWAQSQLGPAVASTSELKTLQGAAAA